MPDENKPKLIIDSDWKSQAQAEKAKLSQPAPAQPALQVDSDWKAQAQAEKEKLAAKDAAATSGGGKGREEMPEASMDELVRLLATQALMYLGAFPDPVTGKAIVALDYARLHIDMLGMLQDKTKGNLTPDEQQMLSETTHELRLQYVAIGKAVAKAMDEGRLKSAPGMGGPGSPGGVIRGPSTGPASL